MKNDNLSTISPDGLRVLGMLFRSAKSNGYDFGFVGPVDGLSMQQVGGHVSSLAKRFDWIRIEEDDRDVMVFLFSGSAISDEELKVRDALESSLSGLRLM